MKPLITPPIINGNSKKNHNTSRRCVFLFVIFFFLIMAFINVDYLISLQKHAISGFIMSAPFLQSTNISCNNIMNNTTSNSNNNSSSSNSDDDELRILISVLTLADHYRPREFLRQIYQVQPRPPGVRIDVKFVFCNLTKDDQKVLVSLEIMSFDDIIILNCTENMDDGKTYTFFSSLPEMFFETETETNSNSDSKSNSNSDSNSNSNTSTSTNTNTNTYRRSKQPYHYVMKTDDDTFIRLDKFVESVKPMAREDAYYGFVLPCKSMDPRGDYMAGLGYMVSWDIVEWIKDSDIPMRHTKGPEDRVFSDWLREGHRANNSYNMKWKIYNYPRPRTACTHPLWPDTIAVHSLKSMDKWMDTLNYFNFTKNLQPSKLYHI